MTPIEIDPDGRDLQHQVRQVERAEEVVVLRLEDDPDQREDERDAQRAELREARGHLARSRRGSEPAARRRPVRRPRPAAPARPARASARRAVGGVSVVLIRVAPVIAPTTSSCVVSLVLSVATRRPRRSTMMRSATSKTSTMLWLIRTTPSPRSRRRQNQVEHLPRLRDAERGGRLVEHHDLRIAEQRARDRDRLALPARQRADLGAHAAQRRDRQRVEQLDRAASPSRSRRSRAPPSAARSRALLRRGRGWRRRRGCRTARGPGRRSRSRAAWRPAAT